MWDYTTTQTVIVMLMVLPQLCKPITMRAGLTEIRRPITLEGEQLQKIYANEASIYEYTFMAVLVEYKHNDTRAANETNEGQLVCAASIIHKDWIITAARCFNRNSDVSKLKIHGGVIELTSEVDQQIRSIKNILIHPHYNLSSDEFNLAMIRVTPSFKITANLHSGYLPTSPISFTSGERCQLLGFTRQIIPNTDGRSDEVEFDDILLTVRLHAIDNKDLIRRLKFLKSDQVYTFTEKNYGLIQIQDFPHNNSQGACEGDVGGPCVCGFKLQGIIAHSTNKTCYSTGYPTTIVDVGHHLNWIRGTILELGVIENNLGLKHNGEYILIILSLAISLLTNLKCLV